MNSCVLMARIRRKPELRHTPDTQTPVTDMIVEFEGSRPEEQSTLRVVGWGNLATEIHENYAEGDRVIIEGRLSMTTIERREGFKEKRAELIASRIHRLDGQTTSTTSSSKAASSIKEQTVTETRTRKAPVATVEETESDNYADFSEDETTSVPKQPASTLVEQNLDEIPFVRPVYSKTSVQFEMLDPWEASANAYWEGVKQILTQ